MNCTKCGKDITNELRIYKRAKAYCYDCFMKTTPKKERKQRSNRNVVIKSMYRSGYKPSEIAKTYGITAKEVYEILNS